MSSDKSIIKDIMYDVKEKTENTQKHIDKHINKIRNSIVANASKNNGNVTDPVLLKELQEVTYQNWHNFLGEIPTTPYGEFKAFEVKNLRDTYYVAEGYLEMDREILNGDPRNTEPSKAHSKVHKYVVKHDNDIKPFSIVENTVIEQNDVEVTKRELKFNDHTYKLNPKTDIDDINSIRYQMRDNPEVTHFIDKFLIVTPEQKTSYIKYELQQKKRELKIKSKLAVHESKKFIDETKKTTKEKLSKAQQERVKRKQEEYFTGRQ